MRLVISSQNGEKLVKPFFPNRLFLIRNEKWLSVFLTMPKNRLQLIKNAVAKVLAGTKKRAHITRVLNPVLKPLLLLSSISLRIDFKTLIPLPINFCTVLPLTMSLICCQNVSLEGPSALQPLLH